MLALFLATPALQAQFFTDVTASAGIDQVNEDPMQMSAGLAVFDYDGDDDEDLYFTGGPAPDQLYRNNGDGTFTDVSGAAGITAISTPYNTTGVLAGDIDNDGFRDLFVGTWGGQHSLFLHNNGDGTFSDFTVSSGVVNDSVFTFSLSLGDYNGDGFLDVYLANYIISPCFTTDGGGNIDGFCHTCMPNTFYLNNGNNTFTESAALLGLDNNGCGLATAMSDFDNDHDADILLANDFGEFVVPNRAFRNDFPGGYLERSQTIGLNDSLYGMGWIVGDYDHDEDLDYYITNIGRGVLRRNDGGIFTDVATMAGVEAATVDTFNSVGWGGAFIDYDNNMWQDLFIVKGYVNSAPFLQTTPLDPNVMFQNNMDGTFTDITLAAGVNDSMRGRGMSQFDFDDDGDMDMVVATNGTNSNPQERSRLWRNELANSNHFLKVKLRGTVNNRDAIGAKLCIDVGGERWITEVTGGASYLSQPSLVQHFGLAANDTVDSLTVIWPGGGTQTQYDIPADTTILIIETPGGLPVELAQLRATPFANYNAIQWYSTEELNFSHYELQAIYLESELFNPTSIDPGDWRTIGEIAPKGSASEYYYQDSDFSPLTLYRLKMVDLNGLSRYSHYVMAKRNEFEPMVRVFPNPTQGEVRIEGENLRHLYLFDLQGRKVMDRPLDSRNLDLSEFPAGVYMYEVQTQDGQRWKGKLVRE